MGEDEPIYRGTWNLPFRSRESPSKFIFVHVTVLERLTPYVLTITILDVMSDVAGTITLTTRKLEELVLQMHGKDVSTNDDHALLAWLRHGKSPQRSQSIPSPLLFP